MTDTTREPRTPTIVAAYLGAIVVANLLVATFGPAITIPDALIFVAFDLTARDRLHDAWHHDHLWLRMAALIAAGGFLSWLVNGAAGQIALASTLAFLLAGGVDSAVYTLLGNRERWVRVNGSNVLSAAVDSIAFPTIAFGSFLPLIVLGQFTVKVLGGAFWYGVLSAVSLRRRPA